MTFQSVLPTRAFNRPEPIRSAFACEPPMQRPARDLRPGDRVNSVQGEFTVALILPILDFDGRRVWGVNVYDREDNSSLGVRSYRRDQHLQVL